MGSVKDKDIADYIKIIERQYLMVSGHMLDENISDPERLQPLKRALHACLLVLYEEYGAMNTYSAYIQKDDDFRTWPVNK